MENKTYHLVIDERSSASQSCSPQSAIVGDDATSQIRMISETKQLEYDSDDQVFSRFTALTQRTLKIPYAVLSLDDGNRQLFISKIGFPETKELNASIYGITALPEGPEVILVSDASSDGRIKNNPHVIGSPFLKFFAGTGLVVGGRRVGSLCVFDTKPRLDFNQDEIMILADLGLTVTSLIKTQREYHLNLEAKFKERLKLEQKKFACNLVMEKNKIVVDLMHQVRTPLMGIQLSVSMIESEQQAISEIVQKTLPHADSVNKLVATIQELKSATSQLDNYVTTNLKSEANMIIDNSLNRILNQTNSYSHDSVALSIDTNSINNKIISCNFNDLLYSIRHKCYIAIKKTEIEWSVNPRLTKSYLETHPEIFQSVLWSILFNASTIWNRVTVAFEVSEKCGCHHVTEDMQAILSSNQKKSQDCWYGFISVTVRLYERLPCLLPSNSTSNNSRSNNYTSASAIIDTKPLETILCEIGGCCRVFNFDCNSSSSSSFGNSCYNDKVVIIAATSGDSQINEQLIEFFIPCVLSKNDNSHEIDQALGPSEISLLSDCSNSNNQPLAIKPPIFRMRTMSLSEESHCSCSCSAINEAIEKISQQNSGKYSNASQYNGMEEKSNSNSNSNCSSSKSNSISNSINSNKSNSNNSNKSNSKPMLARRVFSRCNSESSEKMKKYRTTSNRQLALQVLLVDDSAIIYKVMKKWLEAEGCEVTIAENGKIALSYLKVNQYDLTLMDFIMPVMLGKVAMKYYQEWKVEFPHLHFNQDMLLVGMSANASPQDQKEAFQYGMHYFATKPMELTFLKTLLEAKKKYKNLEQTIQWIDFMTESTSITVNKSPVVKDIDEGWNSSISNTTTSNNTTSTTTIIRKKSTENGIRKTSVILKLEQTILEDSYNSSRFRRNRVGRTNTNNINSNYRMAPRKGCISLVGNFLHSICRWSSGSSNNSRSNSSHGTNGLEQSNRFSKKVLPEQIVA